MFKLVVLFIFVAVATARPGYLHTIPAAISHQSRVDVHSSPVFAQNYVEPALQEVADVHYGEELHNDGSYYPELHEVEAYDNGLYHNDEDDSELHGVEVISQEIQPVHSVESVASHSVYQTHDAPASTAHALPVVHLGYENAHPLILSSDDGHYSDVVSIESADIETPFVHAVEASNIEPIVLSAEEGVHGINLVEAASPIAAPIVTEVSAPVVVPLTAHTVSSSSHSEHSVHSSPLGHSEQSSNVESIITPDSHSVKSSVTSHDVHHVASPIVSTYSVSPVVQHLDAVPVAVSHAARQDVYHGAASVVPLVQHNVVPIVQQHVVPLVHGHGLQAW